MLCAGMFALAVMATTAIAGVAVVEVQVLPNGQVIIVQVEGESEFCIDPADRSTCRQLTKSCDFVVADRKTRKITDPEPVSAEAVIAIGGVDAFHLMQDPSELTPSFKQGGACGLDKSVKALVPIPGPIGGSPN
jgi:hypothetical protein